MELLIVRVILWLLLSEKAIFFFARLPGTVFWLRRIEVLGHDSVGIMFANTGYESTAVNVFPETEVSGLQRAHSNHHQNIENLLKDRFSPRLDWVRESREILETSGNTDERTKAKRAEILWNRRQNNIKLLVFEIDLPLAGNDRVGGIEDEGLNAHLSIRSLQI